MILGLAFRNLFRNQRRTVAVLMTIALGAGALFCFQGFISGVLKDYRETTIHSHNGNGAIHTEGYQDTIYQEPWKHWITNAGELEFFLLGQEGVEQVFPRVSIPAMLQHGKVSITGQGEGIAAEREAGFFNSLNIEEGEALSKQPNGILLGKGLAKALNVHPGDELTLYTKASGGVKKAKLKVTGIFHTGSTAFDNHVFRIQLKKAQELLQTKKVESLSIGLSDHSFWKVLAKNVEEAFPGIEVHSFAELDKVYYQNSVDWLDAQFQVVQFIILSIVLLGIFNSISAAILERKQEIGNLRANGESRSDVMKLILCEGAFLGLMGSVLGLGFTYLIAMGVFDQGILMPPGPGSTRQFFISFHFTWQMVTYTFALSLLSALLAAFLAGLKVAKMPIAKALRSY